jgi:serine O-acetyltransferase
MKAILEIRTGSSERLTSYVATQLHNIFPDEGLNEDFERLRTFVDQALERIRPILAAVRTFEPNRFDHFHTLQYATFLYLVAHGAWLKCGECSIADRLYALNRALHSIDLFYRVELPEIFFLSHATGAVLGNVGYGARLVVFQGVTVGRIGDSKPTIGDNVILFPGATITGSARIGSGAVIGAGTQVHGIEIPADSVLMRTRDGAQELRPRRRDYSDLYFRPERL